MTAIHVQRLFDAPSAKEKESQRREIEQDMAEFLASGGKVQVLGTTPFNKGKRGDFQNSQFTNKKRRGEI